MANPAATTYSAGLEAAVAGELEREFAVELVRTEEPGHAVALGRAGAGDGSFAAVAVLGGDGAVNEVANGLAGSDVPLVPLPGGRTSVLSRLVGLPRDARRAAEALVETGDGLVTRRIDLGTMNGRYFTFASGIGLSAAANRRLSGRGATGRRLGGHLFLYEILAVAAGYLRDPPRLAVEVDAGTGRGRNGGDDGGDASGDTIEGVTLIVQNADPLTYLGSRPLPLCEGAGFDTGSVSLAVLRHASPAAAATVTPQIALGRGATALRREHVCSVPDVRAAQVTTLDGRPLPVEVDGDYVGELESVSYGVAPAALLVGTVRSATRAAEVAPRGSAGRSG